MLVIKEKGKPKQGRIQRGFVKGGMGGGRWYQSTSERNFQLKLFFLVQTRRNVKIVLQLPQNVARARPYAIGLVFRNLRVLIYLKLYEKNHVITYANITVLGIIRKKEGGGGVRKTVLSLLQQHVLGAGKVNQSWQPQMMFL